MKKLIKINRIVILNLVPKEVPEMCIHKRKALFLVLTTLVLLTFFTIGRTENAPAPRIKVDQDIFDFGKINQGEKVLHTFKVKNAGNADLFIKRVRPTCGCTVVEASAGTLKPNEVTEIKVIFDSKNYRKQVNKYIHIESDDPETPNKRLTITGEVEPSLAEVSIYVKLNESELVVPKGKETTQKILVRNNGREELKLKGASTSSSKYKINLPAKSIPHRDTVLSTLRIKPIKKGETLTGYVYLEIAIPITVKYK